MHCRLIACLLPAPWHAGKPKKGATKSKAAAAAAAGAAAAAAASAAAAAAAAPSVGFGQEDDDEAEPMDEEPSPIHGIEFENEQKLEGHEKEVFACVWSPREQLLASG